MKGDDHRTSNSIIMMDLCNDIKQINDPRVRMQATNFCDALSDCISRNDVVALPSLSFSLDEGDAFFEWVFDSFRFGFLFSDNPEESGWYLVTKAGGRNERFRSTFKGKETVKYIFNYIVANA